MRCILATVTFALSLGAISLSTMACGGSHVLCKEATPPAGTPMPPGKTCQSLCNKIQCPNCCDHTTAAGRARDDCNDKCASMAMLNPGGSGPVLASIVPAGTMAIVTASPVNADAQYMAMSMTLVEQTTMVNAVNCQTPASWAAINQTLGASLANAYSAMSAAGIDVNSADERAAALYTGFVSGLLSAPGNNC